MPISGRLNRKDAIAFARTCARSVASDYHVDQFGAQVMIYHVDGRFQSERTYPDLTPRRKG